MSQYKTIYVPTENGKRDMMGGGNHINGDSLARDVQAAIQEMVETGYKVVQLVPIYGAFTSSKTGASYEKTDGVLILLEKIKES